MAEIKELERKLAAKWGEHTIWFQKSENPKITAEVSLVNGQYRWYILRQYDERSAKQLVKFGDKPTLAKAKAEVFKVFDDAALLKELVNAKEIRPTT